MSTASSQIPDLVDPATLGIWSEKDFQSQVRQVAKTLGWLLYATWDSRRSPGGFPDLVLVRPPRVILAECKRDAKRSQPSAAQQEWLDALHQCPGVETYLWRPRDWDDLVAILSRQF